MLKSTISLGLPELEQIKEDADPIESIQIALDKIEDRRRAAKKQPHLVSAQPNADFTKTELAKVVRWALSILRSVDAGTLNSDRTPTFAEEVPTIKGHKEWRPTLRLLDRALVHPAIADEQPLHREFIGELKRVSQNPSPFVSRSLFSTIRLWHWLHESSSGKHLLRDLLQEKVSDPGSLLVVMRQGVLSYMPPEQPEAILRKWVLTTWLPPDHKETKILVAETGVAIGGNALRRKNGERQFWSLLADELLENPPTTGPLTDKNTYFEWASQIIFGAKSAFLLQAPSQILISDYASLLSLCWHQIKASQGGGRISTSLLWACEPIGKMTKVKDPQLHRLLWSKMKPILCSAIESRHLSEINYIFYTLRDGKIAERLGAEAMMDVLNTLHVKVQTAFAQNRNAGEIVDFGPFGDGTLEHAAELAEILGTLPETSLNIRTQLFGMMQRWTTLGIPGALAAAQAIRRWQ
ncbi:hypothetical protein HMI49_21100 [Corallococcus exercitus]|uniref:Uncharacterized protein n=1 Tax=Corallococcus exercitus TaxID=2316736 RepID=A0A7Y4KMI4_9BACT|nr:hypothetical protein [Corallococcus exercitus]NOK35699.1 hypothetical protein [Corallococcus exercitus]